MVKRLNLAAAAKACFLGALGLFAEDRVVGAGILWHQQVQTFHCTCDQQNGEAYSIVVIPANTKAPIRGMLTVVTDLQLDGKNRKFFAYAEVRPTGNPQTTSNTSNF